MPTGKVEIAVATNGENADEAFGIGLVANRRASPMVPLYLGTG